MFPGVHHERLRAGAGDGDRRRHEVRARQGGEAGQSRGGLQHQVRLPNACISQPTRRHFPSNLPFPAKNITLGARWLPNFYEF